MRFGPVAVGAREITQTAAAEHRIGAELHGRTVFCSLDFVGGGLYKGSFANDNVVDLLVGGKLCQSLEYVAPKPSPASTNVS